MEYMSFGPDAGHLMERLLAAAGTSMAEHDMVKIQPEGEAAALDILREAAEGGWVVELLDVDDEPDSGEGEQIILRQAAEGEIAGDTLSPGTGLRDHGYLRLDLRKVEKVHIF
jgi:hypothetical protein